MLYFKKKFWFLMFCLTPLFLTGCWNNRDITDLGIVVGMGLDKVSNDQIEITIQLLNPSIMESRKQGSMLKATNSISAVGRTVFEANRNLLTKINKKLFYAHIQLVVLGDTLAENGIENALDFFQRVHEIDKRELVLISKGITAKELFDIDTAQSDISSMEIINTLKNTYRLASIRKITLYDVILNNVAGENSIVGKVEVSQIKEKLKIKDLNFTGAAVFKKDKLIGWLNPIETYGYSITDNKFENPILTIPNPISPEDNITLEIDNSSTKKNVYFKNDKPVLYIEVNVIGKMVEQNGKGDLTSTEQIKAVETEASQQLKKLIMNIVKNAQENQQTDIFNFGDIVHKKHLKYWRKVKSSWNSVFRDLPVEITVQFKIENMGFIKEHK